MPESPQQHDRPEPPRRTPMTAGQTVLAGLGFLSFGIGVVGMFVPLLPTTEFIMLAAFLFAKSSPRFHAWLLGTKVYRTYVEPFLHRRGAPMRVKTRMAATSALVLGVSAILLRRWYVWIALGLCLAAICYVLFVRLPTTEE